MHRERERVGFVVVVLVIAGWCAAAHAQDYHIDCPDYHWWYGCTPTSVGMMMGWYDRTGYKGNDYGNLIPGGVAGFSTHVKDFWGNWEANGDTIASKAIASSGHIADFWGEDHYQGRPYDCIADFIGTSQGGSENGATDIWSSTFKDGTGDYFRYRGYGGARVEHHKVDDWGGDFTYEDFKAEIDAGRPVLLCVQGEYAHSMVGYGYDYSGGVDRIMLHDTWEPGRHKMWWGGAYYKSNGDMAYLKWVTTILPDAAMLRIPSAEDGTHDFGKILVGDRFVVPIVAENAGRPYADGTPNSLAIEWPGLGGNGEWSHEEVSPHVTLAPAEQCAVDFAYTPLSRGADSTSFLIDSDINHVNVRLEGCGVAPVSEVTTADAGLVRIGTRTQARVWIRNIGDGNLAAVNNPTLWDESCLRGTVAAVDAGPFSGAGAVVLLEDDSVGGGCSELECAYLFEPIEHGPSQCVVACDFDNGGNNRNAAHTVDAVLSGTGVGPVFSSDWEPGGALDFGDVLTGEGATFMLDICNATTDDDGGNCALTDLTLLDLQFTGPDADLFDAPWYDEAAWDGLILHRGEQWVVELAFTAPMEMGEKLATLTITTDQGAPVCLAGETFAYDLRAMVIPEPMSVALLAIALSGMLDRRRFSGGRYA